MIPGLRGALEVLNPTEENRVVHIGELCCQRKEPNSYCINVIRFSCDLRVFFPLKKKTNRFIFLQIHRTIYRVLVYALYMHYKISSCFFKNGYNTLPGFTIIPWNQIIVITRNAVRNDE